MGKTKQKEMRSSNLRRVDDKKRLREQKSILAQKDLAIREVLKQIEQVNEEVKSNIIANVENILMPIVQKLEVNEGSYYYIQLLRNNLHEMTSTFGVKLSDRKTKLTPREIEICDMIRNGLTNKEIASLLRISIRTIEKHRTNIRKKLDINKDDNLLSFLQSLE